MSADLERLLQGLRAGRYRIEVDVPAPQPSADLAVASQLARQREDSIRRGVRIARVFHLDPARPGKAPARPSEQVAIDEAACGELIDAGAAWIGPPHLNPRP